MVNLISPFMYGSLVGPSYDAGFGNYDYSFRSSGALAVYELFAKPWGGRSLGVLGYGGYASVNRTLFGSLFYPPFLGLSSLVLPYDFVNAAERLMGWGNAIVNSYPWNAPHLANALMRGVTPSIPASTWPPPPPSVPAGVGVGGGSAAAPRYNQTLGDHGGGQATQQTEQRVKREPQRESETADEAGEAHGDHDADETKRAGEGDKVEAESEVLPEFEKEGAQKVVEELKKEKNISGFRKVGRQGGYTVYARKGFPGRLAVPQNGAGVASAKLKKKGGEVGSINVGFVFVNRKDKIIHLIAPSPPDSELIQKGALMPASWHPSVPKAQQAFAAIEVPEHLKGQTEDGLLVVDPRGPIYTLKKAGGKYKLGRQVRPNEFVK